MHSYAGYIEEDEYIAPVVMIDEKLKEKEKEKSVTFMEDGTVRKMFPYKVYGPRGYSEGNNETVPDELLERKKEAENDEIVTKPHAEEEDEEEEEDAGAAPAETASDLPGRPQCRTRALL